MKNSGWHC